MRRRFLAAGRVQGVGFRHFVRQAARRLGLIGWVRNLAEGGVEVLADGTGPQLDELEELLRRGPPSAIVTNLQTVEISDETNALSSFDIMS